MRAYFFGNMYLSSIQQGIQAGHCISEMAVKYQRTGDGFTTTGHMFYDWAENHKTMILLNGGYGENLHDLYNFVDVTDNSFPFARFHESTEALDGAVTSVGIVLPAKIYDGAREMRNVMRLPKHMSPRLLFEHQRILTLGDDPTEIQYTEFEVELMTRLNTFKLAS